MDTDKINTLLERYKEGRISRRDFLRGLVGAAGTAGAASILGAYAPPTLKPSRRPLSSRPAVEPKVLIYTGGQDIPTIDPSDRGDYSINCMTRALYDSFFWQEGWPPRLTPNLCTSYEASEDAREWTFHLTDKAVFHDGTPVTAEAVKFTIDRTLRFAKQRANALLPIMDENSVQIVDNHTVRIVLTNPSAELPWLLTYGNMVVPIMNPKVVMDHEKGGDEGAEWLIDHEAGSGPFVIKRWEPGTVYELEAVPDYWRGWPEQGRLAGVIWRIIRESSGRRMALLVGEVDVADTVAVDDIPLIEENPGTHVEAHPGYLAGYIKLNNQQEPFSDVNFRKFLAHAYDYEGLITLRGGPQYGPLIIGCLPEGVPGHDPNVQPIYRHDLEKAREYLDKTPWKDGGLELDFVYVTGLEFEEQMGLVLLEQLANFNIKLNMVAKVWPDMVAMSAHPETGADTICVFVDQGPVASQWFRFQWYSPFWDREEGGSFQSASFYKNPEVDALVEKVEVTVDEEERMGMVRELQRMIMEDIPEIPLFTMTNILAFNDRVKGYEYTGYIALDFWPLCIE